ncbi:hypothetical protein BHF68_01235 [Desulfuribacillus alkaliarsenatis]|uniref:Type 4 fimbrial biogenesis protein PilX N-terminal domain-containing protein n=1 Tax=Desulfuribacillus alkaliarsenatis TaxID=766136 RepID=A0A1E5G573_9FIRM|nr:hypothetical protein BHF68_01235 [Desulfuribacillus alkaliarsenatis]
MFCNIKNQRGIALPLVVMVMISLLIVGGAFATYTYSEINQTTREDHNLQAYYLARSGVELALDLMRNSEYEIGGRPYSFYFYGTPEEGDFSLEQMSVSSGIEGYYDTSRKRLADIFFADNPSATDSEIIVCVISEHPSGAPGTTGSIVVRGKYRSGTQYLIRNFVYNAGGFPSTFPDSNDSFWNELDAKDRTNQWLNPSGKIQPGNPGHSSDEPVIIRSRSNNEIAMDNNGTRPIAAPAIYFLDDMVVDHHDGLQYVYANFIYFSGEILLEQHSPSRVGAIVLRTNEAIGCELPTQEDDKKRGVVYFSDKIWVYDTHGQNRIEEKVMLSELQSGYYYFEDGTDLSSAYDIQNKLIKINNPQEIDLGTCVDTGLGGGGFAPTTFQ